MCASGSSNTFTRTDITLSYINSRPTSSYCFFASCLLHNLKPVNESAKKGKKWFFLIMLTHSSLQWRRFFGLFASLVVSVKPFTPRAHSLARTLISSAGFGWDYVEKLVATALSYTLCEAGAFILFHPLSLATTETKIFPFQNRVCSIHFRHAMPNDYANEAMMSFSFFEATDKVSIMLPIGGVPPLPSRVPHGVCEVCHFSSTSEEGFICRFRHGT